MSHNPHGRLAGLFLKAFVQALRAAGASLDPRSAEYKLARNTRTQAAVRRFTTTD